MQLKADKIIKINKFIKPKGLNILFWTYISKIRPKVSMTVCWVMSYRLENAVHHILNI